MQREGVVVPFRMTAAERKAALAKLAGGPSRQTSEYDGVQLFRENRVPKVVAPKPPPKEEAPRTRTCGSCGSKVPVPKRKKRARVKAPPQKRWFLYYGPDHMTGGFLTKQDARNWYLKGGR
jgi:hypothetical protein